MCSGNTLILVFLLDPGEHMEGESINERLMISFLGDLNI